MEDEPINLYQSPSSAPADSVEPIPLVSPDDPDVHLFANFEREKWSTGLFYFSSDDGYLRWDRRNQPLLFEGDVFRYRLPKRRSWRADPRPSNQSLLFSFVRVVADTKDGPIELLLVPTSTDWRPNTNESRRQAALKLLIEIRRDWEP